MTENEHLLFAKPSLYMDHAMNPPYVAVRVCIAIALIEPLRAHTVLRIGTSSVH